MALGLCLYSVDLVRHSGSYNKHQVQPTHFYTAVPSDNVREPRFGLFTTNAHLSSQMTHTLESERGYFGATFTTLLYPDNISSVALPNTKLWIRLIIKSTMRAGVETMAVRHYSRRCNVANKLKFHKCPDLSIWQWMAVHTLTFCQG